ncbi:ArsR/SmtB family transcription factor [Sulfuriferula thiophila]|uniref:ArsR/SmtB family transcription factor n=1 Tax=Sulfuriferula thiophila TaxID=1781211 RepID=UPI000F60C341|nr:metalloregulator ArsR/SmtB family transcription factor [Sulfuriferula thiophila]
MLDIDTLFATLADATRRQILAQLLHSGESCVCHLYGTLDISQPKVSRHLAVLREAGLVSSQRRGTWIHYSINPDLPCWAQIILAQMSVGLTLDASASPINSTCCAAK